VPKKFTHLRATALALGASALLAGVAFADPVRLLESGSSLLFPMFQNQWVPGYNKAHPDVVISPQAGGSGKGIADAIAGIVQIGGSDAYLSDPQVAQNPGLLSIPLAVSSQTVDFNIPGWNAAKRMVLSGPVLAGIYQGTIRNWNDPAIARLNPGVALPANPIVPIRRSDGSGDTFIFTQFLTFSTPDVHLGAASDLFYDWGTKIGYGTAVPWPSVPGGLTATGNQGMLRTIAATPYALGYLGGSFEGDANKAGLHIAMLRNQDGKFLLPTAATVTASAAVLTPRTPPDERLTLVFAPGANSYPLINYEYAIVSARQPNPQVAAAVTNFLVWCISPQGGNAASFLAPAHFIALPPSIHALSEIQIAKIQ
jgi:phosphate transport system substrate-binding protein